MSQMPSERIAWHRGDLSPLSEIFIPATDRGFEHGLGLFETMRGQNSKVPLWPWHHRRLVGSAAALGLVLDESRLPGPADFASLIRANGLEQASCRLRLVLTGGTADSAGETYVVATPLEPMNIEGLKLADDFWPVDNRDTLVRHKSLNYWARRLAHERAAASGADDALSQDQAGAIWESARSALFLVVSGKWFAPPANGPMLASVAAGAIERLLNEPGQPGLTRRIITPEILAGADEVILANAVRGPMSVSSWRDNRYDLAGPGFTSIRTLWRSEWF
ncbi:hypothetical protein GC170_06195 [bacterium]|nr:hypothetical protein [bacterium]